MKIAVTSNHDTLDSVVPQSYENSEKLLIIETDDMSIVAAGCEYETYMDLILKYDCEVVVCGPHIGQAAFEPIANAGITRFNGAGLSVAEAAKRALLNNLPYIRDYEGGDGCHH